MGLKLRSNRAPSFTFSNLPASVDEGQSISPIISFTAADDNIIQPNLSINAYWEISGVGIASTDFENVGADGNPDAGTTLTGYVNLTGNTTSKQFAIGIRSDNFTDLNVNETATFSIYSDASRTELIQSDTFIINDTSMGEPQFDFLLVGAGGAGGRTYSTPALQSYSGGGGGAGGVLVISDFQISPPGGSDNTVDCIVGPTNNVLLAVGGASSISCGGIGHYVNGGGGGGCDSDIGSIRDGADSPDPFGGSGGGGAAYWGGSQSGGTGGDYGNNGYRGYTNNGGGGGGGFTGNAPESDYLDAGNGGTGYDLSNFFSELNGTIAGGGGGGAYSDGTTTGSAGLGRAGGGNGGSVSAGSDAEDNTGSGGGGSSGANRLGGDGGSGVIYLKYIAPESLFTYSGTQTVNSYIVSSGGGTKKYWVHKLTSSGTLTRVS